MYIKIKTVHDVIKHGCDCKDYRKTLLVLPGCAHSDSCNWKDQDYWGYEDWSGVDSVCYGIKEQSKKQIQEFLDREMDDALERAKNS